MSRVRLDQSLLKKLVRKTGKIEKYLREQISVRAGKLGVSSEAFLILWAKKEGIGTAVYQRKLPPHIQLEVREALPYIFTLNQPRSKTSVIQKRFKTQRKRPQLTLAIEYLIQDKELFDRCEDLIKAKKKFDRVFREVTTVLEDRIKKLSGINLIGTSLIGKALNPDPAKAVLKVSDKKFEQQGFFNICNGLILAFRNTTHHELSDKFTEQDALKFCGFIDSLLAILEQVEKSDEN